MVPFTWGISCCLWADGIRIELNSQTLCWHSRSAWWVQEPTRSWCGFRYTNQEWTVLSTLLTLHIFSCSVFCYQNTATQTLKVDFRFIFWDLGHGSFSWGFPVIWTTPGFTHFPLFHSNTVFLLSHSTDSSVQPTPMLCSTWCLYFPSQLRPTAIREPQFKA